MNSTSPNSSSAGAGTDPTQYSPLAARNVNANGAQQASSTQGRLTTFIVRGIQYVGGVPNPAPFGGFVNELDSRNDDFISRVLFIQSIPSGIRAGTNESAEFNAVQHELSTYRVFNNAAPLYSRGMYIRFDNLRHSCEAKQLLEQLNFTSRYVDSYDFAVARGQDTGSVHEFEGQIKVNFVAFSTTGAPIDFNEERASWLIEAAELEISQFGLIRNIVHVPADSPNTSFTFRVEFFSMDAAARAVGGITQDPIYCVSPDGLWQITSSSACRWEGPRPANSPHRRNPRRDFQGRLMGHLHQPDPRGFLPPRHPADTANRVCREDLENGTEVRLTVMIRNIPNKMDWMEIARLLHRYAYGKFNCLYVRIDFQNGQNMGYGFVNFTDVTGLLAVLDNLDGRPWSGFSTNRLFEMSFATMQGSEALIERYRNSYVRQAPPYCRSHLFLTHPEALASNRVRDTGTEVALPNPNNLMKLQRSAESAQSVGLYKASGSGKAVPARFPGSTYDRGSPRDLLYTSADTYLLPEPANYFAASTQVQRQCEQWYALNYGFGRCGMIHFSQIPQIFVQQFLQLHSMRGAANPGVIGSGMPDSKGKGRMN